MGGAPLLVSWPYLVRSTRKIAAKQHFHVPTLCWFGTVAGSEILRLVKSIKAWGKYCDELPTSTGDRRISGCHQHHHLYCRKQFFPQKALVPFQTVRKNKTVNLSSPRKSYLSKNEHVIWKIDGRFQMKFLFKNDPSCWVDIHYLFGVWLGFCHLLECQ